MPTPAAEQALSILRDGSQFQWYVIPIFVLVVYVYAVEVERRNWNLVFAGLALWGVDWFNEIWNSLVFHFTNYAPVWGAPGKTAYLILIGLNIEICFNFFILAIVFAKMLPPDKNLKVLGIPNRWFFAVLDSIICVIIELLLNSVSALTWDYSWWNARAPWLIFLIGYFPFFVVSFWVYDMKSVRTKAVTVGAILAFDAACLIIFGAILKWI
ncbi:MAG: hypothetical protein C4532_15635 [Candidatus Abyssobacteria bacterium SURF_17]|uniref:Carotenoid biosynthesis protein n=1 Tax=Candidatus Abyssobacteria bacterium SURF_17 TaxID=2093361 RepID=A0A419ESY6_9BACT|nr:MAG: hypothetical protein C4532_15635 [Candidatus Abyssubacteria bacterium SURF_17]